ncbi:MAG: 4-alpha-glucanotransferase [Clostridium sp.]|nr:4-alpha-glucanotransferase [Clostridium sp.]
MWRKYSYNYHQDINSIAKICIVPIQDYLGLDNKSRMNTPSSVGNNWRWRVDSKVLNKTFAKEIKAITVRYERCN